MSRTFLKMNGLGNDFVVVEARETPFAPSVEEVRAIAARYATAGSPGPRLAGEYLRARVEISEGPVVPALRASCSAPWVLSPRILDGRLLIDGGMSDPCPPTRCATWARTG